jgi:hypothetical protein
MGVYSSGRQGIFVMAMDVFGLDGISPGGGFDLRKMTVDLLPPPGRRFIAAPNKSE